MGKAPEDHTASEGASVLPCHDTNTKPMEGVSCAIENVPITKVYSVYGGVGWQSVGPETRAGASGVGLELQRVLNKSPLLAGGTQRTQLDPERCLLLVLGLVGLL